MRRGEESLKVTNVRTFFVDPGNTKNWLFVKIDTDEGVSGWGEAYTLWNRDRSIEAYVNQIKPYIIGRSPFNIKNFTQVLYEDYAGRHGGMDYYCAISGVEQALWDIVGKWFNTPVYNLIGGACREKIRVYANGWFGDAETPQEYAEKALEVVKNGFHALKFYPFRKCRGANISRQEEKMAVDIVRAVRETVGPDIELLIDIFRQLSPKHAVKVARMLEEFRPFWYEEPIAPDNIEALAEVSKNIHFPVVTGEALYTKSDFRRVLEKRAVDIINPDVCSCGGILELKEIAAMAEPYHIAVSPHNYNSNTIGLAASLNVSACIPNFLILEYLVNFKPRGDEISVNPFQVEGGYISIPQGPGLGLELDEKAMMKYPYKDFTPRRVRQYYEEVP